MSNLMVDFIISLDGYGAAEGWPGLWGMEGPEYLAWLEEDGGIAAHGPHGRDDLPADVRVRRQMPDDPGFVALTAAPKVVFSSTLKTPLSWADTELVDGDAVEAVQSMNRRLATAAHARQPQPGPVATPSPRGGSIPCGRLPGHHRRHRQERIFDGYPDIALDLVETRTFDGRLQLLEYVPTVLDGPPGAGD